MGIGTGTAMFEENRDLTAERISEMREAYPDLKVVVEQNNGSILSHTAKLLLYAKEYNNFSAKFYAELMPASFVGADIYEWGRFQYSVSTCSGDWQKRLKYLERIIGEIDEKGIETVKKKFNGSRIGTSKKNF